MAESAVSSAEPVWPRDHRYDILAVVSSAGGVKALIQVLGALPADFAVPVLVVQHLDPRHETVLAEVLDRRTPLQVKLAEAGEIVVAGTVYVAPPNRHLCVEPGGVVALSTSRLIHFVRPSADPLFESVAAVYDSHAIGCVLTGTGSDGSEGVRAIGACGGTIVVEDPASAEFKGMPQAAVATGVVDYVLPLDDIAAVLRGLVDTNRTSR